MWKRVQGPDRIAAAAVLLGVIAVFVPWYSYTTAATHVTVNGFRSSLLGDLFFLAIAATALLLLMRTGVVEDMITSRMDEGQALLLLAGAVCGAVLLQLILNALGGGRSLSAGFLLAVLSAIALAVAAWLKRPGAVGRLTVRQMLEEDPPD